MTANFVKLGFTPGFGLTHTLSRIIGHQKANLLFFTGRRITGETAYEWGLADLLVSNEDLRDSAIELAAEIAENAPLAVVSLREQVRGELADAVKRTTDVEGKAQFILQQTNDHKEGIRAVAERRAGNFTGT
jgi:enoyl-CoA hydratase/carnithine racemase